MNRRGSVLIAVTWILGFLAIFTLAVNRRVSQELFMGSWVRDQVLARSMAKAGVERAMLEIQSDEFLTFDALNESWASNPDAFEKGQQTERAFFMVTCHDFDLLQQRDTKSILYGACDESGKINLNFAAKEVLSELVKLVVDGAEEKQATNISESILDWRDPDDAAMPSGAETNYYKAFPKKTLPRNKPFATVEELRMVRGVSPEVYEAMKPYVTVYSEGPVNFNTAPLVVLQAHGITLNFATKIVEFRSGDDLLPGTEDDQVFQIVEGITPALSQAAALSPDELEQISNLVAQEGVDVKSSAFRIRSIGRLIKNSRHFDYQVECVVGRDGKILYWSE